MRNFSIGTQVRSELDDFASSKVRLAAFQKPGESARYLSDAEGGYYFNQSDTLTLIDLYDASKFESGPKDTLGQEKLFINIGTFRREVASKQIDIDTKDFRFLPDDYADPYTAIFMQKDFKEWVKDTDASLDDDEGAFGDLVNQCVENFPKYGTIVLKKVGNEIKFVPLQVLKNEQTARSLRTAEYVIEEHPDMQYSEMKKMKNWNVEGLSLKLGECLTVYERYGYVPEKWLNKLNGIEGGSEDVYVDAVAIIAYVKTPGKPDGVHVFFAEKIDVRPYREKHWKRQHGRWLGIGVMEDLFPNQKARNVASNLLRRGLQWSGRRAFKSTNQDYAGKNLVRDFADGDIIELGANGDIQQIDLSSKSTGEFMQLINDVEKNADQKAFTYEVATGEALPSGTPFRLGVMMSNSVQQFYGLKREKLGRFLKLAIQDFMLPQFVKDMDNEDRTITMFAGESGFEVLKEAAMQYIRTEAARASLLSGKVVDVSTIIQAVSPFEQVHMMFFAMPKGSYKEAKVKFDFTVTGEEVNLEAKLETLKSLYQLLAGKGDPRADKVLDRIAALSGESMAQFGSSDAGATGAAAAAAAAGPKAPNAQPTPAAAGANNGSGAAA